MFKFFLRRTLPTFIIPSHHIAGHTHIGSDEFLTIIHAGNRNFALGHIGVVVDVFGQEAHFYGRQKSKK